MAQPSVKTVQYVDPRIEPQPDPLYDYVIGPTQNQYYQIPASGLSDSNITFNNLTTLGTDRAYLDTFEIELRAKITFTLKAPLHTTDADKVNETSTPVMPASIAGNPEFCPAPDEWTFQSFPFNTCCDEARVNINGGAFFSQPLCYIRAKERYMDQAALCKCYENICPCIRPMLQYESGRSYGDSSATLSNADSAKMYETGELGYPTRYGVGMYGFNQGPCGLHGFNNDIVKKGAKAIGPTHYANAYTNYERVDATTTVVTVTWREPLFVSPFSSRYDATYGRPLYNITSMDLAFNMSNLQNMIRVANIHHRIFNTSTAGTGGNYLKADEASVYVDKYDIHIESAKLCYQVMTIPNSIQKPLTTLVPYRRFVPFITEYNQSANTGNQGRTVNQAGEDKVEITSGVYTFNEIPTAIWVFVAPVKSRYQTNVTDRQTDTLPSDASFYTGIDDLLKFGNFDSNKLFGFIDHVNISMANTTQILNTAKPEDLYRIAKANGCQDSFFAWNGTNVVIPKRNVDRGDGHVCTKLTPEMYGPGSVLRLKPGVDIVIPDIPLIPAANANNMVFQTTVTCRIPPNSTAQTQYALWCLFEYVGVAAISPGQCEITMNPLGDGKVMAASPVMSATTTASEGVLGSGSSAFDAKKLMDAIANMYTNGSLKKIIEAIPGQGAKDVADWIGANGGKGSGMPGRKRMRGGAVMGTGMDEWM